MSNDRIYIRCTSCNERTLLTKHYPSTRLGELAQSSEEIGKWISEHLDHHPNRFSASLYCVAGLLFETESIHPVLGETTGALEDLGELIEQTYTVANLQAQGLVGTPQFRQAAERSRELFQKISEYIKTADALKAHRSPDTSNDCDDNQ